MNAKSKIAFSLFLFNTIGLIGMGVLCLIRDEFLPFHANIMHATWQQASQFTQILYIGMLRTEAAGYLSSGVAMLILLCIPFRQYQRWAVWAITVIGLIEYAPSLVASYHVAQVTGIATPWPFVLGGMISLCLAALLAWTDFSQQV